MGLTVIASTGSSNTFSMCHDYGADICLDHTSKSFLREVVKKTGYLGVDFVLDYGASNLQRNIECCRSRGKVFIVDLHGMLSNSINLAMLEKKQVEIKVFDLQSRDLASKASLIAQVRTHLWPAVLTKKVIPVVGYRFAVTEAQKALSLLKENDNIEKIILRMNFEMTSRHLKMD
ncbi:uncharacterized protein LOC142540768 [Primulina tabacum]|uniref:uncharacterized protein LOC142540768 n=1 Tax=Primulina tabacum TaxID=48773 RepID=UPI003F5A2C54